MAVEAPFEGNVKKMHDGTIVTVNAQDGTCDISFRFNPNVVEHGIPVGKLERKLSMDPALMPKKKALEKVMKHLDSKDFLQPVLSLWPPEAIPNYAEIVKRPMDLGTVKKNLARGLYNGKPHEMLSDMELVFHNCQSYTAADKTSEYYLKAGRMLEFVRDTFNNATAETMGGGSGNGQKRQRESGGPAQAKRPALGLGAAPAAKASPPRSLAMILNDVKLMPPMLDKPVRTACTIRTFLPSASEEQVQPTHWLVQPAPEVQYVSLWCVRCGLCLCGCRRWSTRRRRACWARSTS